MLTVVLIIVGGLGNEIKSRARVIEGRGDGQAKIGESVNGGSGGSDVLVFELFCGHWFPAIQWK